VIFLYTGKPGAGKTLFSLADLVKFLEQSEKETDERRPVYVSGVDGLNVDHPTLKRWSIQELEDPHQWPELPKGSVVYIDEVQRVWRPRRSGSQIPHSQSELETHRHQGMDFFLTTQGAHLLDSHVHALVDRHVHIHRSSASERAHRYEWAEIKRQPRSQTAKDSALVSKAVAFPKETYDWYRSAEVHTHQRRVPWRLIFKLMVPALLFAYVLYSASNSDIVRSWLGLETQGSLLSGSASNQSSPFVPGTTEPVPGRTDLERMTYEELHTPEVPGQPWTAPIYRDLIDPNSAPIPNCIVMYTDAGFPERCKCRSQQGTIMQVEFDSCIRIAENGFFDPSRSAGGFAGDGSADRAREPISLNR